MEERIISKKNNYDTLASSIRDGNVDKLYIFHGEERYLLEHSLGSMRKLLCPNGLDGFNYNYFDGSKLTVDLLENAIDTLPVFADKTFIEIHDFNLFKGDARERFCKIFADLPDYVCIVFVFNTIEYKPDGRQKLNKELLKHMNVIDFVAQGQDRLVKWIKRHFADAGKNISTHDAEYLSFITGGLMVNLKGEIEKVAAYSKSEMITKQDIDTVVTPVLDTVVYKLADALASRNSKQALQILDELFQMREVPHRLISSVSIKMRQLLAARICIENNLDKAKLMKLTGIRFDFQAKMLMNTANKAKLSECRAAVLACAATALELNSTSTNPESQMIELVTKLALV
ncbi:MAG: DNA polymerase III subunit delta [Oscillospiraceae bacterium]|nr:DNA polymerase III subunit delta [Oscillospiraceae bacterium]